MRFCAFLLLTGLTAFAAGCGKGSSTDAGGGGGGGGGGSGDLDGKWTIHDVELPFGDTSDPKATPAEKKQAKEFAEMMKASIKKEMASVEVVIKDGTITATMPGKDKAPKGKFTFAADKSPKEFDLTPEEDGKGKAETIHGIYKQEGDTLTVAASSSKAPRPTEFKAVAPPKGKMDDGVILITLKKKYPRPGRPAGGLL